MINYGRVDIQIALWAFDADNNVFVRQRTRGPLTDKWDVVSSCEYTPALGPVDCVANLLARELTGRTQIKVKYLGCEPFTPLAPFGLETIGSDAKAIAHHFKIPIVGWRGVSGAYLPSSVIRREMKESPSLYTPWLRTGIEAYSSQPRPFYR